MVEAVSAERQMKRNSAIEEHRVSTQQQQQTGFPGAANACTESNSNNRKTSVAGAVAEINSPSLGTKDSHTGDIFNGNSLESDSNGGTDLDPTVNEPVNIKPENSVQV